MAVKVMYLMDYYISPNGGTEGQVRQLIEYLDRSRYEPALTLLRSTEYIERNEFVCPVRVLGITTLTRIRSIFKILCYALRLRRENYKLIHCFFNDSSLIAPLFRFFGMRIVVSRRDMGFWHTPWILAALRVAVPFTDRYLANSKAVKLVVHQREWVPEAKVLVIYNGYVPRIANNHGCSAPENLARIPSNDPIIGIVANLSPVKRVDILIEAFAIISKRYPNACLLSIGGHGLSPRGRNISEELLELANRLGVRERVIFTGPVDNPEPYINQFTVAVLCSESEGFSNSIIEYMQAGRPIVCTDTGGNPELIQDGHNGFLVAVGDARALADRIARLLSDRALAHRFCEAARKTVQSAYTHTRMVAEHMACYDEVLSGTASARRFRFWPTRT